MEGRVVHLQHGLEAAGDARLGLQVLGAAERYRLERHRRCAPGVSVACGGGYERNVCDLTIRGAMAKREVSACAAETGRMDAGDERSLRRSVR